MMKKILKIAAPLLMLAVGIGVAMILDLNKPEPEEKKEIIHAPSLMIDEVSHKDITLKVYTQAEVKANIEVDIVSQLSGLVKAVSPEFVGGGRFAANETLLWIDDADYQLGLEGSQARVAEADVRVKQAEADAEVARVQLLGTKNPSPLALKKPQLAEARANLIAAQADLSLARLKLDRTRISLPFEGRLKSTSANIGQYVAPGTILARGFATDKVKLRLPLTDQQLTYLGLPIGFVAKDKDAPRVDLKAFVAGKERSWQGSLKRIEASFDETSRLIYALVEVDKPYHEKHSMPLAVGLFVNVEIYGRKIEQALVIPRPALRSGNKVYLVSEQNRLHIKTVDVVYKSSDLVVIDSGLEAGQKVVISTVRDPIEGMDVLVMEKESIVDPDVKADNG